MGRGGVRSGVYSAHGLNAAADWEENPIWPCAARWDSPRIMWNLPEIFEILL